MLAAARVRSSSSPWSFNSPKYTSRFNRRASSDRPRSSYVFAMAEARLSDLRAKSKWEKAVKLFFSALKNADASARVALYKDPEGEIEKLLETVEEATGEQALATIN